MEYREKELEKYLPIWLTKESHLILKKQKRIQKKSMMRIIDDLIKKEYEMEKNK
jgi:hypothetical protein